MRNKRKIFNDPIYGFINFEYDIIYDIIEHPYFQRLRRISQCGLSNYVYPGANHTRFHHALGATHLMSRAIRVLRDKGIEITEEEAIGATIAILLHDIGHGPFSHALERFFINRDHEDISLAFMKYLNHEFDGQISLAIQIFEGNYHKKFLYQLVSSQLDMDRMDYLNRDSYFTGVSEGIIGYDRIIKMLNVSNNQLVVEEKGIYSVEKFLMARRLMYGQVYLHKTGVITEQMLRCFMLNIKKHYKDSQAKNTCQSPLLLGQWHDKKLDNIFLKEYALLDDSDVLCLLKSHRNSNKFELSYLSSSMLDRKLFQICVENSPFDRDFIDSCRQSIGKSLNIDILTVDNLIMSGKETTLAYDYRRDEIIIMMKNGELAPLSKSSEIVFESLGKEKYFVVFPKYIS